MSVDIVSGKKKLQPSPSELHYTATYTTRYSSEYTFILFINVYTNRL